MKRINDLEIRYSNFNKMYELVQWNKKETGEEYCFVIAFFRKGKEGCNIEFIGNRPFLNDNSELVWTMLKYGQSVVDAEFNLEESIANL